MLNIATVFSGIGSIEYTLKKMDIKYNTIFACDNGERKLDKDIQEIKDEIKDMDCQSQKEYIDNLYNNLKKKNFVYDTYKANFNIKKEKFYQDIRFLDGKQYEGKVDLFVGGSPCQSFSICGHYNGLDDVKGTLFYDYARLIKEIQPKVFIYENVPGMITHDNGNTFKTISSIFDSLEYKWKYKIINSKNCGIPQNRRRLFIVGFRRDLNVMNFEFPQDINLDTQVKDYLDKNIDRKYYYGETGFKWVTNVKNIGRRVGINSMISRTQAANQQFNWCGDAIFESIEDKEWIKEDKKIYIGSYNGKKGILRKMTPRECLRLMGYGDEFKIVVPDRQMYRQCGNSIVVNVLELIMKQILNTSVLGESYD